MALDGGQESRALVSVSTLLLVSCAPLGRLVLFSGTQACSQLFVSVPMFLSFGDLALSRGISVVGKKSCMKANTHKKGPCSNVVHKFY